MKKTNELSLLAQLLRLTISWTTLLRSGVFWSDPAIPVESSFQAFGAQLTLDVVSGLEVMLLSLLLKVAAPLASCPQIVNKAGFLSACSSTVNWMLASRMVASCGMLIALKRMPITCAGPWSPSLSTNSRSELFKYISPVLSSSASSELELTSLENVVVADDEELSGDEGLPVNTSCAPP